MTEIYTKKTKPYTDKNSPYSKPVGELEFLLNEDGGYTLQENTGKIILKGIPGYTTFNPYSKKTTPYSLQTA